LERCPKFVFAAFARWRDRLEVEEDGAANRIAARRRGIDSAQKHGALGADRHALIAAGDWEGREPRSEDGSMLAVEHPARHCPDIVKCEEPAAAGRDHEVARAL
jgi:hypothetical protein